MQAQPSMSILKHASYGKTDFQILKRETLYKGFVQVEKLTVEHRLFDQSAYIQPPIERELVHRHEAAGVLLYDDQHQCFGLIEQFRVGAIQHGDSPWHLEVIAGLIDEGESPEQCIRREAVEESGCHVQDLTHLFSFYPSSGASSEYFHLYAAETDLSDKKGNFGVANEGEDIKLHIIAYQDLAALMAQGRLQNAPVIMALQWLQQHLKT